MYKAKKKKKVTKSTYSISFRFWQNSIEYFCMISAPVEVEKYRLKEIFDRAFVNKKELPKSNPFLTLNQNVSYTISKVKETVND